jgi:hypothetical protein
MLINRIINFINKNLYKIIKYKIIKYKIYKIA